MGTELIVPSSVLAELGGLHGVAEAVARCDGDATRISEAGFSPTTLAVIVEAVGAGHAVTLVAPSGARLGRVVDGNGGRAIEARHPE